jgi:hypothetical protein
MSSQQVAGSARAVAVIAASQLRGPSAAITLPVAVVGIGLITSEVSTSRSNKIAAEATERELKAQQERQLAVSMKKVFIDGRWQIPPPSSQS